MILRIKAVALSNPLGLRSYCLRTTYRFLKTKPFIYYDYQKPRIITY
jgi:hypothetical protein